MRAISAIEPSRRREGRFELLVDGEQQATLSLEAIERLQLRVGIPFEPVAEAVARETALLATYDRAVRMLAFRARAASELRRNLLRKGEPAEYVDAAIDRLRTSGFLDDSAFARQFTRARSAGAGVSRRRIQQELNRRGVPREVTDGAIAEVYEEEAIHEGDVAERAARKKLRSLGGLDPAVRNRRLYAFLARRGYSPGDIRRAIEAVTGEVTEDVGNE